jgi:hypothetical protein
MTSPDIIEIALKAVKVFETLGIEYFIGGSLASSAFGTARATLDIDIIAGVNPEHITPLIELLREEFYIDEQMIRDALKHNSSFNLIHFATMFKVDIFIMQGEPFERQIFTRRVKKCVSEEGTRELFFATPEDIILSKIVWFKKGGSVSDRQWGDILGVMKVQGEKLDFEYLKHWANKLKVDVLLKKAFNEAGLA